MADGQHRSLLDALRAERPAPYDARARVRARLAAVIPEMGGGGSGGGDGGGSASGPGGWSGRTGFFLGPRGMAMAAFVLGGFGGGALIAGLTHAPAPQVVMIDRPVFLAPAPSAQAVAPFPGVSSVAAAEPAPPPAAIFRRHVAPRASADKTAAPARTSQLAAERELLDEARAGLVQGDPAHAIDRLDEHRKRYPSGLLGEERDAMMVEALVRAGRYDGARQEAAAFRIRAPNSMFLPTVDSAIASIP